ncbi:hypothetical protein ALC60_14061 [Trachymyrmex zeteki]|uniref:Uncharacterized protein n=1 Tax=Mycetomoellerius zeteki TaxID=64791 RepID=A0A151WGJ0_9HYME|nr:hypothetical protein ALC60_14061 [Trachymyrmex zeteki]
MDNKGAESYWPPVPIDHCHFDQCNILYEGLAKKLSPRKNQSTLTIYTVTMQDITFALTKTSDIDVCGFKLAQTEHPKLIIKPVEVLLPPIIQPLIKPKWHYISTTTLATSGIYNNDDIDRPRSHIMFPLEKPSMLNTLAELGGSIQPGTFSLTNLLDKDFLNRIAESAGARLWSGFITFGSASAGVLAIFVIIRVTKLVIDTIIHSYALHSMYGWSMHLLGAVWSSVTHLLLHLGQNSREEKTTPEEKNNAAPLAPQEEPFPPPKLHSDNKVSDTRAKSTHYISNEKSY